ncbi:hypothetical protein HYW67_02045 [Candidatus Parcubacteria bacterium]|nr:hypothetical protein [Candidatus Parcubacteria bacterium]
MSGLPRHNRITVGQLTETLRKLSLRPRQQRTITEAFSQYGAEGITRREFEAGLYSLLSDRRYQYSLGPRDIEAVRRAVFPQARPFGRPADDRSKKSGPVSGRREALPERPRLRGLGR